MLFLSLRTLSNLHGLIQGPSVVFKGMALPAFGRADSICSSASKGASSQQKAHRHFGLATLAEQTAHAPSPPGDKAPAGPGEFSTDERVAMDDNPPSQGIGSCSTSSQSCDQNNALEQASRRNSRNSSETASADAAAQASSSTLRSSSKELRSDAASAAAAAEAARQQAWDLEDDLWGDQFTGGATVEPKLQSAEEEELNLPGTMEVVGMAAVGALISVGVAAVGMAAMLLLSTGITQLAKPSDSGNLSPSQ